MNAAVQYHFLKGWQSIYRWKWATIPLKVSYLIMSASIDINLTISLVWLSIIVSSGVDSLIYSYHASTGSWKVIMVARFAYRSSNICSNASFIWWSIGCSPEPSRISSSVLAKMMIQHPNRSIIQLCLCKHLYKPFHGKVNRPVPNIRLAVQEQNSGNFYHT